MENYDITFLDIVVKTMDKKAKTNWGKIIQQAGKENPSPKKSSSIDEFREQKKLEQQQQEELLAISSEIESLNEELLTKKIHLQFQNMSEQAQVTPDIQNSANSTQKIQSTQNTQSPFKTQRRLRPQNIQNANRTQRRFRPQGMLNTDSAATDGEEVNSIDQENYYKTSRLPFYNSDKTKNSITKRKLTSQLKAYEPTTKKYPQNTQEVPTENNTASKTNRFKAGEGFQRLALKFQQNQTPSAQPQNKDDGIEFIERKQAPTNTGLAETINADFSQESIKNGGVRNFPVCDETINEDMPVVDTGYAETVKQTCDAQIKKPSMQGYAETIIDKNRQNVPPPNSAPVSPAPIDRKKDPMGLIGSSIIDKYNVLKLLGRGGMGVVYLTEHKNLGKKRAVKILPKSVTIPQEDVDRFYAEANVAASIEHPNVVQVHDIDETEKFYFIVMEYVKGDSLDQYMCKNGLFAVDAALEIIRSCALGLAAIHEKGLIHRDVKPANFMLGKDTVKIMDFGIAKDLNRDTALTSASTIIGTPQFMAPEMIRKTTIDIRSDIYSLGATFYFLITGQFCFTGTPMQIMYQVINDPPIPPQQYNENISDEVSEVILKMLEKEQSERFADMNELVAVLDELIAL